MYSNLETYWFLLLTTHLQANRIRTVHDETSGSQPIDELVVYGGALERLHAAIFAAVHGIVITIVVHTSY